MKNRFHGDCPATRTALSQLRLLLLAIVLLSPQGAAFLPQQEAGSIRGVVYDRDFDAPLPLAKVEIAQTGQTTQTTEQGTYLLTPVQPGTYTLVFSKEGFVRQVAEVAVSPGVVSQVDMYLAGEFIEMEEFVVQDVLQLGGGGEAALLELRFESPSLIDAIGSDLMSRAGASDAASALKLVAGASVQDGKFAVVRGLPDRYVTNQLNGVRLPTADEDKRAVELDQFPAAVIDNIQVSKTFTPDQQGDASGGAVNIGLKGLPTETVFQFKAQAGINTEVQQAGNDFLSYEGGGIDFLGDVDREPQALGTDWKGAVGVREEDAPINYKFSGSAGASHELENGLRIGGFIDLFYERDNSHREGVDDSLWQETPGGPLVPERSQDQGSDDFKTKLFDVTQSTQMEQWGGLGTFGIESENHFVGLTILYSHTAEDTATLAEDTRGKQFYFPGYDPDDPSTPGHDQPSAAPYLRTETLEYTERETGSYQLTGRHTFERDEYEIGSFTLLDPVFDWTLAYSYANLDQPDKRQFGSEWNPERTIGPITLPAVHLPLLPEASANLGNLQRIWKKIEEDSIQYSLNMTLPFEQWNDEEGFAKVGWFSDAVDREFDQDTYSNFGDTDARFEGDYDELWSESFPTEGGHPIFASEVDVDYDGELDITALYMMIDLPLNEDWTIITGVRFESTDISTINDGEQFALYVPPGDNAPTQVSDAANVDFSQDDVLPSLALHYTVTDDVTLRFAYSQTVARQTFKELSPIIQQEFAGGPIFVGNPLLDMSSVENYDVRVDYAPYAGALMSASVFYKDVDDPIEYVQQNFGFTYTTPVNYPEGRLFGIELEARQDIGRYWDPLEGLSMGANATLIDSKVELSDADEASFDNPSILAPTSSRDMTAAPEYLLNLFLTYDIVDTGTSASIFYTHTGDTLVTGATAADNEYVPDIYAEDFGTLNFTLSQRVGERMKIIFKAKNLTNPNIKTVYRSDYIDGDRTNTSYQRGIEFSIGIQINL